MMDFYHAYYKRQYYDKEKKLWVDTYYDHQGIVVIADNRGDAKTKIEECLKIVERGNYRAVLTSGVVKCLGLDRRHCFDGEFEVCPIVR